MLSNFTQSIMQPLIDNLCAFFHIHVHLLLSFEKFMTNFTTDLYTFKISFKSPHNIMPKIFSSTIVDVHLGSQMLIKITMIEWDSTEKVISVFILLHIDWIKVVIMDHFIVLKRKIFITCTDFTSINWQESDTVVANVIIASGINCDQKGMRESNMDNKYTALEFFVLLSGRNIRSLPVGLSMPTIGDEICQLCPLLRALCMHPLWRNTIQ